jgi:hypothetical protein
MQLAGNSLQDVVVIIIIIIIVLKPRFNVILDIQTQRQKETAQGRVTAFTDVPPQLLN